MRIELADGDFYDIEMATDAEENGQVSLGAARRECRAATIGRPQSGEIAVEAGRIPAPSRPIEGVRARLSARAKVEYGPIRWEVMKQRYLKLIEGITTPTPPLAEGSYPAEATLKPR